MSRMADQQPRFDQVNLVVRDMDATLAFYRKVGLTAAGYAGSQPPYDAFWGARYAIVEDPDGNDVGLMSPIDAQRRFVPSPAEGG